MIFTHTINNKNYYSAKDLKIKKNTLFKGCNTKRKIIDKYSIPKTEYLYAINNDNVWKIYSENYKKAELFISKSFIEKNLIKQYKTIHLKKDENKYDIDIKGDRNIKNSYFNGNDVQKKFYLKNLTFYISNNPSIFHEDTHYIYIDDIIHLTYKGLIKALYLFQSKEADNFQDWAYNDFFLNNTIDNISLKSVQNVLNACVQTVPCIYLFNLGQVKNLKGTFNIQDCDEDAYLYKYGMTKNLSKRTYQHYNYFGKMENINMSLKMYAFIDPLFISEAENYLRTYFNNNDMPIIDDKYNEIVMIPKDKINMVKDYFELISCKFGATLNELKNENIYIKNEIELLKKDMEIQKLNYENKILKIMK